MDPDAPNGIAPGQDAPAAAPTSGSTPTSRTPTGGTNNSGIDAARGTEPATRAGWQGELRGQDQPASGRSGRRIESIETCTRSAHCRNSERP